jgi:hypothetical protein
MGRMMHGEDTSAFRAVVTVTRADGSFTFTRYYGPFSTIGQANAAITREKSSATRRSWRYRSPHSEPATSDTVTGHVETTGLNWTRV